MINLAGIKEADEYILEELYLAGLEPISIKEDGGEVPYSYIGKIKDWTLRRGWSYWSASVPEAIKGLILDKALKLYNIAYPLKSKYILLGQIARAGGDCGSLSPDSYVSQPIYNDELDEKLIVLGYKKKYIDFLEKEIISISVGKIAELCNSGKLIVDRYVRNYHIDNQIGLCEFVKFIKNNT
jgi:hypothetical protein